MPNHVMNEVIFRDVDAAARAAILAKACGDKGDVDFQILLPLPLNAWPGSVGALHEKAFPDTWLDWARKNWGTKWNAYSQQPIEQTDNTLTLRFETAWNPPYGWLAAVFNTFKLGFEHNWLDEGRERGVSGAWNYKALDDLGAEAWKEQPASDDMQKHLHLLHWGVESFPDEDDADDGTGGAPSSTTERRCSSWERPRIRRRSMTTPNLIERLRQPSLNTVIPYQSLGALCLEAADEIERLHSLISSYEERLSQIQGASQTIPSSRLKSATRTDNAKLEREGP